MDSSLEEKLRQLCLRLIDQTRARVIVEPYANDSGYWFGGGNLVCDDQGVFWLSGRYRNAGDSRTGVAAGSRGLELAIFRSDDVNAPFEKVASFGKSDLDTVDGKVLSIEGTALRWTPRGVELYLSTEKSGRQYPSPYEDYLKPNTGIWSIDRVVASSFDDWGDATVTPLLSSHEPSTIHVKDPFLDVGHPDSPAFEPSLLFCTHPLNWSCSNTARVNLPSTEPSRQLTIDDCEAGFFRRGDVWDVAITRGTAVLDVPKFGPFANLDLQLLFYDGGECVRDLQPHASAVARPRGYSCEELGGVAWMQNRDWNSIQRLSRYEPMFVSPHGTGCSRYVDVLSRPDGLYATWQQAQPDGSQPLVMHYLPIDEIQQILS